MMIRRKGGVLLAVVATSLLLVALLAVATTTVQADRTLQHQQVQFDLQQLEPATQAGAVTPLELADELNTQEFAGVPEGFVLAEVAEHVEPAARSLVQTQSQAKAKWPKFLSKAKNAIKAKASSFKATIKAKASSFKAHIKAGATKLKNKIKAGATKLKNKLKSGLKKAGSLLKAGAKSLLKHGLNSLLNRDREMYGYGIRRGKDGKDLFLDANGFPLEAPRPTRSTGGYLPQDLPERIEGIGPKPAVEILAPVAPARPPIKPSEGHKAYPRKCSKQARRRIGFCISIIGAWLIPQGAENKVGITKASALGMCENANLNGAFARGTSDRQTCKSMVEHLLSAAEVGQIEQAIRTEDVHDVCVKLLGTPIRRYGSSFRSKRQRWLKPRDASRCRTSGILQNEGVTGLKCLFFHGAGVRPLSYDNKNTVGGAWDGFLPAFPRYWQNIATEVGPKCDKRFYVADTVTRGWEDVELQKKFCKAIETFAPQIVFAHSSANLVIAGGIANRLPGCTQFLARGTRAAQNGTMWFSANAPLDGSVLINHAKRVCAKVDQSVLPAWYDGVCARDYAQPYKGFLSLGTEFVSKDVAAFPGNMTVQLTCSKDSYTSHYHKSDPMLNRCISVRSISERFTRGSMCGVQAGGWKVRTAGFTKSSNANWLNDPTANKDISWDGDRSTYLSATKVAGHDGFVQFHACALKTHEYKFGPQFAHYASNSNHNDGRCADGESRTDATRQPCSWYSARVHQARVAFSRIQKLQRAHKVGKKPSMPRFRYDSLGLKIHVQDQIKTRDGPPAKKAAKQKRNDGYVDPIAAKTKLNNDMYFQKLAEPLPPVAIGAPPRPEWDPIKQRDDNVRQAARNTLLYTHAVASEDETFPPDSSTFKLGKA